MASSALRCMAVLAGAGLLTGCIGRALLYSRTTQPLVADFDATPVADSGTKSDIKTLTFYVDVEWGHGGIGEIARRNGITEIYYADVETRTILGYWRQDYVRVYGRSAGAGQAAGLPAQGFAEAGDVVEGAEGAEVRGAAGQ